MFDSRRAEGLAGYFKPFLIGVITSIIFTAIFLFIFAFLLTIYDASDSVIIIMSMIAWCIGAFTGGFAAAKAYGKNGLIMGFCSGIIMFLLLTLIAMIVNSSGLTIQSFIKLILSVVSACIGGVMGINLKRKRKLI